MLQTWNKFCFTTGYVEVSVTLPGPDENTKGYVSFYFCVWFAFVECYVAKFPIHKLTDLRNQFIFPFLFVVSLEP